MKFKKRKEGEIPRLRENPLTGDLICFSPERASRPEDFIRPREVKLVSVEECFFCKSGPVYKERIFETENIYVIPNKYPAFVLAPRVYDDGHNFYNTGEAFGVHEVIIRKSHSEHLPELSIAHFVELLEVYQERLKKYAKDPRLAYGAIFHNHGVEAGSSVVHPHSQFIASEVLPPILWRETERQKVYFEEKESCLLCDMIALEVKERIRVIAENRLFVGFLAYAGRYPYEIIVLPKRHQACFEKAPLRDLNHLAVILHKIFALLAFKLKDPALNFIIHTKPFSPIVNEENWHWHIEITPRLEHWGGYEVGTGLIINTLLPEKAARFLRS